MSYKLRKDDVGTIITFRITDKGDKIDLTDAENVFLIMSYKDADSNEVRKKYSCNILEPYTEGKVEYIIKEGDLPVADVYKIQIKVKFNDGDTFHSEIFEEIVEDNL